MIDLSESGHPVFRGISALARGPLKRKRGRTTSTHCIDDPTTAELLFRIIVSVNQLSVYGTVSNWCEDRAQHTSDPHSASTRTPVAELNDESESRVAPNVVPILTNPPMINVPAQGNLVQQHKDSKTCQKTFE